MYGAKGRYYVSGKKKEGWELTDISLVKHM
jgi:hypothetical protein